MKSLLTVVRKSVRGFSADFLSTRKKTKTYGTVDLNPKPQQGQDSQNTETQISESNLATMDTRPGKRQLRIVVNLMSYAATT